jgi:hypothetical protein
MFVALAGLMVGYANPVIQQVRDIPDETGTDGLEALVAAVRCGGGVSDAVGWLKLDAPRTDGDGERICAARARSAARTRTTQWARSDAACTAVAATAAGVEHRGVGMFRFVRFVLVLVVAIYLAAVAHDVLEMPARAITTGITSTPETADALLRLRHTTPR